jgi:hypothetical protein
MHVVIKAIILTLMVLTLPAVDGTIHSVTLKSPLTTLLRLTKPANIPVGTLRAVIEVPADAPTDLGVGVFVVDQHGRWFQGLRPGTLAAGVQAIEFTLTGPGALQAMGDRGQWTTATAEQGAGTGLFFWSAQTSNAMLKVSEITFAPPTSPAVITPHLTALRTDDSATTGQRWSLSVRPRPFPGNPFDPTRFRLDAIITLPDGSQTRIPGFLDQAMTNGDRGDHEIVRPSTAETFAVRFRPRQPGRHTIRLEARWGGDKGTLVTLDLPPLIVGGTAWDDYVRVDSKDPRFFNVGGKFWWARGPNLRSVYDTRASDRLGTVLTPDRGTLAYEAYLRRLAAHGVNAVEIWLSSWNMALEWRADWPGFYGQGRYNLENAWRLDRVLDLAQELGIRVNLVINNHGQATRGNDAEWDSNPYSRNRGGQLDDPEDFFTNREALIGQEQLRRYLIARYADHPAILGWKLWTEINLTDGNSSLLTWHENATTLLRGMDSYGHPVTTHWSSDYRKVDHTIAGLPGIDFVCIDAYHREDMLADLIWRSTWDPDRSRSLAPIGKPVLTTEFGGSSQGCSEQQMRAEHASGPFAGLVSGHAGSPMLWWFEWLDQGKQFAPYRSISAFIAGEDLRSPDGRSVVLKASSSVGQLWARAWSRPGRMLGYLLDREWGRSGEAPITHAEVALDIGSNVTAGQMRVEWWDADAGALLQSITIDHAGGPLRLKPPTFLRHIAFKVIRLETKPVPTPAEIK